MRQNLVSTKYPNLYVDKNTGIFYVRIMRAGKAAKKSLRTMDINVALSKLASILAESGSPMIKIESISLHAVIELYLGKQLLRPELKQKAKESIEFFASMVKKAFDQDINVASITPESCRRLWGRMADRYSARTANGILGAMRGILKEAIMLGSIQSDPTAAIAKMPIRRGKLNIPSRQDFRRIVEEVKKGASTKIKRIVKPANCHTADAIEFLAYSGCRIGEAVQIRWRDINGDLMHIPSNKHATDWRVLPINAALQEVIDRMRIYSQSEYILQIKTPSIALTNACKRLAPLDRNLLQSSALG